jgi:hypothetical protein
MADAAPGTSDTGVGHRPVPRGELLIIGSLVFGSGTLIRARIPVR